jgi:hypothetical protein
LPFYLLHLPPDTLLGYSVIRWQTSIAVEGLAINVLTVTATLEIDDLPVKRSDVTRFLSGMRLERRARNM